MNTCLNTHLNCYKPLKSYKRLTPVLLSHHSLSSVPAIYSPLAGPFQQFQLTGKVFYKNVI